MNHVPSETDFSAYAPQARRLALEHIRTLQGLPPVFCALLLTEISQYDTQFPAERSDLTAQLKWLESDNEVEINGVLDSFAALQVSKDIMKMPWASQPVAFLERLTADLWLTHSIDAFHAAGKRYGEILERIRNDAEATTSRLCMAFIGAGSQRGNQPLFEKLKTHGTYFTQVNLSDGIQIALAGLQKEARANPVPFQHWYVDGGAGELDSIQDPSQDFAIRTLSYTRLKPIRQNVIEAMDRVRSSAGSGPERLRNVLAQMHPSGTGTEKTQEDEVMQDFVLRLFTEGSGTQIFSTTFVQWSGREILRRARPQTLLVRFQLRQRERPMDELLDSDHTTVAYDPRGSLIDADMGAYYTWINLQRLPGAHNARFIACFENGCEAVVVAPGFPKATTSDSHCSLRDLLAWAT